MRVALTIAGSDSGGGAGMQADIKTFSRFGLFGTSVVTAVTAQNTRGVTMWESVSPKLVTAQIDAIFSDLVPEAVKTGMIGTIEGVRAVAQGIRHYAPPKLVIDPVMVATSGDLLLDIGTIGAIRDELIPLAHIVTPNTDEAHVLLNRPVRTLDDMIDAARDIVHHLGADAALVKGGHLDGEMVVDVLYDGEFHLFRNARIETTNTHGTGCTLSAAITANLALGMTLIDSVGAATKYVHHAIATAPKLGNGHGPLNHFA